MTILITGGAGFIGSNFIYYILSKHPNYKVLCLDCLTYAGNISTLAKALEAPNFKFLKANICDRQTIYKIFENEKPNIVINFAAESHVDRSIKNPEIFLKTNILGTQTLMDACNKYGIYRYHQISTDEVYGELPLNSPNLRFNESSPIRTNNPYSCSKASADLLAMAYYKTYGLPVTISRSSNNYGPYQFPEKLIPLVITNAFTDKPIPIYGNGLNVREWLHVNDHCSALDLIIHKGTIGEIYNVGGNCEMTNVGVAKLICKELNKPEHLITYIEDRKGHDLRYAIDSTKIQHELDWTPKIKFEDGIKATVCWYRDHIGWWEKLKR